MSPTPVLCAVVGVLLVALLVVSGIGLAWGIVVLLAVAIVALACLFLAALPRWPG